jgi:hypothetical protein
MKRIPLDTIEDKYKKIYLKNGKEAFMYECLLTKVKEINPDEEILVYKYKIPCPLCDTLNRGFSYDGIFFSNTQITCSNCGIYYRGIAKP